VPERSPNLVRPTLRDESDAHPKLSPCPSGKPDESDAHSGDPSLTRLGDRALGRG
jgi:hypothetical protein